MLFEYLYKNANDDDSEPFQDLIEKAIDWSGVTPSSGFKKKKKVNLTPTSSTDQTPSVSPAEPPTPKKKQPVKPLKIKQPAGSPVNAGTHTTIQLDSNTAKVKKVAVTPDGAQNKTYHEGVGGNVKPAKLKAKPLIIPATANPKKKAEEAQNKVTYKQHPSGETVATGHPQGKVPVDIKLDDKGKWYHDKLKVGDKVGFNGWSDAFKQWTPVESEVTELNPNGEKLIHVKHLHQDFANDPDAPPMQVHYNKLNHFKRKMDSDPGKWEHYEYPGEYQEPTADDPQEAPPEKKLSAEEHHQHAVHQAEIVKAKTDSIKKHLEGGDVIEFWMKDPMSNKLTLNIGTAHNMATLGGPGGAKKASKMKSDGKDGEAPEVNNVIVQTKYGFEDVPLDHVKRFGKYLVDELHMFQFNPETLKWERDGKSAQESVPVDPKQQQAAPETLPSHVPHPSTLDQTPALPVAKPATPPAVPQPEQVGGAGATSSVPGVATSSAPEVPQQNVPSTAASDPTQDIAHTIMDAGAKFLGNDDEDGSIFFQDPKTGRVHAINKDNFTHDAVLRALGKTPAPSNKDSFSDQPDAEKDQSQDITQHWTHQLPEDLVGHVRGLLDKIDAHRKKGDVVPPSILIARHNLLNNYDSKKAMKNAAKIEEYLHNPDALPKVKPPLQREDFQKKFNGATDFNSISLEQAKEKLGSNKPASPMLQQKQQQALDKLNDMANEFKLQGFSGALGQINPDTDNRNLINFYKVKLEDAIKGSKQTHQPFHLDMPSDEHIEQEHHLDDLADHMQHNGLLIPSKQKKLQQLQYFIHNAPDSPMVGKLMNELHNYSYETGPNDPHFKLATMEKQIDDLKADKLPPGLLAYLKKDVDDANNGLVNPEEALKNIQKLSDEHGLKLKIPEPVPYDNSEGSKAKLDAMVQHRKLVEEQKKIKEEEAKAKASQVPNEAPKAATPVDQNAQNQQVNLKVKDAQKTLTRLQTWEKNYNKIIQDLHDSKVSNPDPATQTVLNNMYKTIQEDFGKLQGLQKELGGMGIDVPMYKPNVMPYGSEAGATDDVLDKVTSNISKLHNDHENRKKQWLENQIGFTHNDIQVLRSHFMSRAMKQLPAVQQDLKNIDSVIGQMLNDQQWKPVDIGQATTPQGKQFLELVNEKIEQLRNREQLAGIPLEEALGKSLGEIIISQKKLARRDVSLALRKSFYNDKDSPDLQHATNLLSSYVDDFIDAIMNTYTNIPVSVRKSITSKLLKSLINDVIKDNEYSAMLMKSDYTAPLDESVIKSLGRRIAGIVTEFRMETNGDPMLVINLNKSITTNKSGVTSKYFTHGHRLMKGHVNFTHDVWSDLFIDLEDCMYKAGILAVKVSPYRISKFVGDNDQKSLTDFYNENLEILNNRLSEMKDGR